MLRHEQPLRYGGEDHRIWSRGIISPGGAHVRHLEEELEDRFLALEKQVRSLPVDWRFEPDPVANIIDADLPRFDLQAMKRNVTSEESRGRDANAMEKAVEEGSKKGSFLVDSSSKYINEFIRPPVPLKSSYSNNGQQAVPGATGGATKDSQVKAGLGPQAVASLNNDGKVISPEDMERVVARSRKDVEEKEAQLRKLIKKNRKAMGLMQ